MRRQEGRRYMKTDEAAGRMRDMKTSEDTGRKSYMKTDKATGRRRDMKTFERTGRKKGNEER